MPARVFIQALLNSAIYQDERNAPELLSVSAKDIVWLHAEGDILKLRVQFQERVLVLEMIRHTHACKCNVGDNTR